MTLRMYTTLPMVCKGLCSLRYVVHFNLIHPYMTTFVYNDQYIEIIEEVIMSMKGMLHCFSGSLHNGVVRYINIQYRHSYI